MIHYIQMDVGGYDVQIKLEVIDCELTMVWVLDESFSPENKEPEWIEVDYALWFALERPIVDYLANIKHELH